MDISEHAQLLANVPFVDVTASEKILQGIAKKNIRENILSCIRLP